ncbi:hypothetical protein JOE65_000792 [Arthrobacter roseus]|nr:hypothetical protein [Arthrobacter roseus]
MCDTTTPEPALTAEEPEGCACRTPEPDVDPVAVEGRTKGPPPR